jgi:hypothetical protein
MSASTCARLPAKTAVWSRAGDDIPPPKKAIGSGENIIDGVTPPRPSN